MAELYPSVEQAIGRDRVREALRRYENKPSADVLHGLVRAENPDGSYEVLLPGDVQPTRCAGYCSASVGDVVAVLRKKDGACVAVGRLGGEDTSEIEQRIDAVSADVLSLKTAKVLWSGAHFISEGQTATLSEAISDQPHGIVVVFSLYESGAKRDTDWSYHFIPKHHVESFDQEGLAISSLSQWLHMAKYLYVGDTTIRGNGNNGKTSMTVGDVTISNGSYVMRYVLGV